MDNHCEQSRVLVLVQYAMKRMQGTITATLVVVFASVSLMSLLTLDQAQRYTQYLSVLEARERSREQAVLVNYQLMTAVNREALTIDDRELYEFVIQGRFNLAELYDRLGPNGPSFLDPKMALIFRRLLAICGLPPEVYAPIIGWVQERPARNQSLPIDGLVSSAILPHEALDRARQCFRFDPKIHRAQLRFITPQTLAAWLDIPLVWAERNIQMIRDTAPRSVANLEAIISQNLGMYSKESSDELGYSDRPSIIMYGMFHSERPYGAITIGLTNDGQKRVLNQRVFWHPASDM